MSGADPQEWLEGIPDGWHLEHSNGRSMWHLVRNQRARARIEWADDGRPRLTTYDANGQLEADLGPYESPAAAREGFAALEAAASLPCPERAAEAADGGTPAAHPIELDERQQRIDEALEAVSDAFCRIADAATDAAMALAKVGDRLERALREAEGGSDADG